jgi:hypothetical protein
MLCLARSTRIGADLRDEAGSTDTAGGNTALGKTCKPAIAVLRIGHTELGGAHAEQFHTALFASGADGVKIKRLPIVGLCGGKAELADLTDGIREFGVAGETRDGYTKSHNISPYLLK